MTPYEEELANLASTVDKAGITDIDGLKAAIEGASEASLIAIGSGGSFTVASLLCSLHEAYTGRVSRAVTPLELICNPTLASTSPIFIISAEGKNPDVIEALQRAREHSSRSVHVVTNRSESPLMARVSELHDVTPHVFPLADKDGYLATNSLVFDAALVARAYGELDRQGRKIQFNVDQLQFDDLPLRDWIENSKQFAKEVASRRSLIIVFSPHLRPIAEDLESKFSESALLFCQLADFRSFAHGRHLWLTERPNDSALLVLTEPAVTRLWDDMHTKVPTQVPHFRLALPGAEPKDLIAGLIAGMHLVSSVANASQRDIARPTVSDLGRQLYYADLTSLIPPPLEAGLRGEHSKYEVLGAHWPSPRSSGTIRRARQATEEAFNSQRFRSIVFDYDGTLCSSNNRDLQPPPLIVSQLERLTRAEIIVGIASGRGGSIRDHLRSLLAPELWPFIRLGLYNGGWIGELGQEPQTTEPLSEFLIHAKRLILGLKSLGVPIEEARTTAPYQLSIRFRNGVRTEDMWFVIVDTFKQAGLDTSTIVRSKHSIDVLSQDVSKSHLVASIVREQSVDPYEVVTMGDLGAWPGNDASLLQHRFSLSVDLPSRRIDRGWKLAPRYKRDVDATLWYLERLEIEPGHRRFYFDLSRD
ncbi:hypothetical protein RX330_22840 [Bradyrhizobium sp. NDS-1]|uniref:hypothetical protein n=1 Tax=Bradyrhizobium sp. NDS-1 TaxID=3080014 RepID=UPI00293E02A8|nr:hypothetical protein [Bradyrhizobium sp. NDS-1]WOH71119.1 hypothetical protein RX330_22840 [Bradyrhizobium sp. NDS-1]